MYRGTAAVSHQKLILQLETTFFFLFTLKECFKTGLTQDVMLEKHYRGENTDV